ncbi:major paralogous domain-containing protein [Fibrobacter sp. UWB13]|nr:major paralogous domain-containing protein [Fibrobacter sp. UWB13]
MTEFLDCGFAVEKKWNIGDVSNWDLRKSICTIHPDVVCGCSSEDCGVVFDKVMRKNLNAKPKNREELKTVLDVVRKWIDSYYFNETTIEFKTTTIDFKTMTIDLNFIDVSKVTDMSHLFEWWFSGDDGFGNDDCFGNDVDSKDDVVCSLDISGWDVSNVTDMEAMFQGSRLNVDLSKWNVSKVKNMKEMFSNSSFKGDLSKWDVSNVENMSGMFSRGVEVKSALSHWNVGHVKDMSSMFSGSTFNEDISKWDVSNVLNMEGMFEFSTFNGDISRWNVSKVKNMSCMFQGSEFHGNLSKWTFASNIDDMFTNSKFSDEEVQELLCKPFTDPRDGEVYKTCRIGNRIWMAENLRYRPLKGGSLAYDKDPESVAEYGRLYSREVANAACPPGWHLPSEKELNEMFELVGKIYDVSDALRAKNWDDALDVYGFNAVPSGLYGDYRIVSEDDEECCYKIFENKGKNAFYWLSEKGENKFWRLGCDCNDLPEIDNDGEFGDGEHDETYWWKYSSCYFSIRCIKD